MVIYAFTVVDEEGIASNDFFGNREQALSYLRGYEHELKMAHGVFPDDNMVELLFESGSFDLRFPGWYHIKQLTFHPVNIKVEVASIEVVD